MTQYVINIGTLPNDGTGDPLRTAFNDVNLNFNQVWATGLVGSNIGVANNTIQTTNTNGNLVLAPNGVGIVQSNVSILPNISNVRNLGSSTQRWSSLYVQYANISGNIDLAGNFSVGDMTVTGNLTVTGNTIQVGNIVTETLTIQLANAASTANAANGSGITVGANDNIATLLYSSTSNTWTTNIGISSVGNVTAPYFFGNGSQLTGIASSYGNSDVAAFLAAFGSNTISTTGNATVGNILPAGYVSATGNVRGANLNTDGIVSAVGNITGGNISSQGQVNTPLVNLGATIAGPAAGGTTDKVTLYDFGTSEYNYAIGAEDHAVWFGVDSFNAGFKFYAGNVANTRIGGDGTISTTGNITGNYFIGNGSQLTGISTASTGNLEISGTLIEIAAGATETSIVISPSGPTGGQAFVDVPNNATANTANLRIYNSLGNIELGTNSGNSLWSFDATGNVNLPVNGAINFNNGGIKQTLNEDFYVRASDNEADGWSIYNVVDDGAGNILSQTRLEFDQYTIRTDGLGASYTWAFRDTGVLELPGDIYGNVGDNLTIKIGDQAGSNTFIDLQTRSYVGDALISNIRIANPDVTISTASAAYNWIFDGTNGFLTFPRDASNVSTDPYLVIDGGGTPSIQVVNASQTGPGNLGIVSDYAEFSGYNGNTVTVYADEGQISSSYNIQLQTPSGIPNSTANINSQGGYNIGSYTNLSTTGGSGTGLTVNASTAGNGYIDTVTINTPGSGYTNSDTITIVGGDGLGCTFTVGVSANDWTFTTTGNLNLPIGGKVVGQTANNNGYINWAGNSSGDGLGYTTMGLIPDDTLVNSDQYLVLDPTAPNHIHIRAGGTQDNSSSQLFLGGENSYFLVENGLNPNVYVAANTYQWKFDNTGGLALATVASESAKFVGTRKIIGGLSATSPYSVTLSAGGTATVAYTAQDGTQSAKVTFAVASNGAGFQWEQFDVVAVPSQAGGNAVNFVVSNRVKGTTSIPDTVVTASMVAGQIQISLTLDAVQTSGGTATFDAVEFGLMVD